MSPLEPLTPPRRSAEHLALWRIIVGTLAGASVPAGAIVLLFAVDASTRGLVGFVAVVAVIVALCVALFILTPLLWAMQRLGWLTRARVLALGSVSGPVLLSISWLAGKISNIPDGALQAHLLDLINDALVTMADPMHLIAFAVCAAGSWLGWNVATWGRPTVVAHHAAPSSVERSPGSGDMP